MFDEVARKRTAKILVILKMQIIKPLNFITFTKCEAIKNAFLVKITQVTL